MTAAVLVVGPGTVSGPNPGSTEKIWAAIDAVDDDYTLLDEVPVRVDDLWAAVIATVAGDDANRILVCPGWWSDARIERIRTAASRRGHRDVVLWRHEQHRTPGACVIEIGPEFVFCRSPGVPVTVTPSTGDIDDVAGAVAHGVIAGAPVVIDVPSGVAGAAELAAGLVRRLPGHVVETVDDAAIAAAVAERRAPAPAPLRRNKAWALSVGALLAACVVLVVSRVNVPVAQPMTRISEGRVSVQIPAGWTVRRVTEGAGSPRVQAHLPADPGNAILLTQSPAGPDLASAAAVLRAALELQPPGVFTGLRTDDLQGGRAVLSYTEQRQGREIAWAVFLDGSLRVAIGCQQPTAGTAIRVYCDEAIRSAHVTP